jgi:hypothetical protein
MKFDESISKEGLASIINDIKEMQKAIFFLNHLRLAPAIDILKEFWIRRRFEPNLNLMPRRLYKIKESYRIPKIFETKPKWLIGMNHQLTCPQSLYHTQS